VKLYKIKKLPSTADEEKKMIFAAVERAPPEAFICERTLVGSSLPVM
jgi:hypothetical protein